MENGTKKFGFIALLGATNSGKSTLINNFVKHKISITSRKVQTTRMRLYGITIIGNTQLVFIDTPGLFKPTRRLDKAMVNLAFEQSRQADKIAILHDCQKPIDEAQFKHFNNLAGEKILLLNKIDLIDKTSLLALAQQANNLCVFAKTFYISALKGEGCNEVLQFFANAMPAGEWLYPQDQISDMPDSLLAAEITREQILNRLHQELPYLMHVVPESFVEKKDGSCECRQIIYIHRQAHKKIVLGKGGETIKSISVASRLQLEKLFKRKVHLFLHIKLHKKWLEDKSIFQSMGLDYHAESV